MTHFRLYANFNFHFSFFISFPQQHLRDEHGNLYSPEEYNLQQSNDGRIHLLPRRLNNYTQHRQHGSQSQQQQQQHQHMDHMDNHMDHSKMENHHNPHHHHWSVVARDLWPNAIRWLILRYSTTS